MKNKVIVVADGDKDKFVSLIAATRCGGPIVEYTGERTKATRFTSLGADVAILMLADVDVKAKVERA